LGAAGSKSGSSDLTMLPPTTADAAVGGSTLATSGSAPTKVLGRVEAVAGSPAAAGSLAAAGAAESDDTTAGAP
jgi:hypothetical protein